MMVLGTHIMDLMRFLAGDPEWVFGHVTFAGRGVTPQDAVMATEAIGPVAGDSVHAVYGFANGVRGYFVTHRGRHVRGPRMGVALVGTEGTLSLRYGSPTRLSRCRAPGAPEDAGPWEEVPILPGPLAPGDTESAGLDALSLGNRLAVWDLVQAAQEGREPVSSGKDARHALEMILGVYASHLAESRLPLPLTNRRHPLTP
jgi:predicted dehydrogenase